MGQAHAVADQIDQVAYLLAGRALHGHAQQQEKRCFFHFVRNFVTKIRLFC